MNRVFLLNKAYQGLSWRQIKNRYKRKFERKQRSERLESIIDSLEGFEIEKPDLTLMLLRDDLERHPKRAYDRILKLEISTISDKLLNDLVVVFQEVLKDESRLKIFNTKPMIKIVSDLAIKCKTIAQARPYMALIYDWQKKGPNSKALFSHYMNK